MDSAVLVSLCLVNMLNASLRFQRIHDVRVVGLSRDFKVAYIVQMKNGLVASKGAVQAEVLLCQ